MREKSVKRKNVSHRSYGIASHCVVCVVFFCQKIGKEMCMYVYVLRNVQQSYRQAVKRVGRTYVRLEKTNGQMYRP